MFTNFLGGFGRVVQGHDGGLEVFVVSATQATLILAAAAVIVLILIAGSSIRARRTRSPRSARDR